MNNDQETRPSEHTGTSLYRDHVLNYDYGSREANELMKMVWSATPWMLEVNTESVCDPRYDEIAEWCRETLGREASPIHGIDGHWQRGRVTVDGWTWYGFATEEMMRQFIEKWEENEQ